MTEASHSPRMHSRRPAALRHRNRVTAPPHAMLLGRATLARSGDRVVDWARASAPPASRCQTRRGLKLVLVEIDSALADLARGNAAANAISPMSSCSMSRPMPLPSPRASRRHVDVVLMNRRSTIPCGTAPRGQGSRMAHVRPPRRSRAGSREPADSEIRRRLSLSGAPTALPSAGGARSRLRQPQILRFMARRRRRRFACWFAPPRAARRLLKSMPRCCSMMSQRCPINRCRKFWREGVLPLAIRDAGGMFGAKLCGSVFDRCPGSK